MGITKKLFRVWTSVNLSRASVHQSFRLLSPQPSYENSNAGSGPAVSNVPGLSANVVKVSSGKVGPGAAKDAEYKHPEYFGFNVTSYYEAEIEMSKFRLPQPSSQN